MYEAKIKQTEIPLCAEIYDVSIGDTEKYYYTSHCETISYSGKTYSPAAIQRGNLKLERRINPSQMTIEVSVNSIFKKYISQAPSKKIFIKITRIFLDGSEDKRTIFTGSVNKIKIQDNVAHLDCTANIELNIKIPPFVTQSRCNHALFDELCGIARSSYKVSAPVTVSGATLSSDSFSAHANGYFIAGHVCKGDDYRLITNHVGSQITLQFPFPASSVSNGTTVDAYPGCDRKASTCKNKFSNLSHFLGFPYIPNSNPAIYALDRG